MFDGELYKQSLDTVIQHNVDDLSLVTKGSEEARRTSQNINESLRIYYDNEKSKMEHEYRMKQLEVEKAKVESAKETEANEMDRRKKDKIIDITVRVVEISLTLAVGACMMMTDYEYDEEHTHLSQYYKEGRAKLFKLFDKIIHPNK